MDVLGELRDEIEYTYRVIRATSDEMEKMILQIKEEMIGDVLPTLENARNEFRENNFQVGLDLLKEAQQRLNKKYLINTRKEILGGFRSEVKNIKNQLLQKRKHPPNQWYQFAGKAARYKKKLETIAVQNNLEMTAS